MRQVVILCGPPGAGKTTAAHASGLKVYDRDDAQWASEQQFTAALAALAHDARAQAVVIRSAATSSARTRWAELTDATHLYVIATDKRTCLARVKARGRADLRASIPAITQWWAEFEGTDGVLNFPGWDKHFENTTPHPPSEDDW